ncbi:PilZ domain-containing protein [Planctomycetota bacterium]
MGIERRIHPRIKALELVSYENYETTKTELMQGMGKTIDISVGGMCFESSHALPLGSTLKLSLALGDDFLECEGMIKSLNLTPDLHVLIHVQFSNISDEAKAMITKFLEANPNDIEKT